jgi:hypothetical protein
MTEAHYTYTVRWSEQDQEYVGTCAEFPSLSHLDTDSYVAYAGIRELVGGVVAEMKAERAAAVKSLEDRFAKHLEQLAVHEPPPDPTIPHGYPSWKDFALALEAGKNSAEHYVDRLSATVDEYHAENDRLRTDRSNMRRELRRINAAMRAAKLELEVLRGRSRQVTQLEHELSQAGLWSQRLLDESRLEIERLREEREGSLSDVIRPVDGFASRNECAICTDPACEEPNGKH